METEALETGETILTWFTDYGALQILAMLGILWPVVGFLLMCWILKTYGVIISELVTLLRELKKERANGAN